MTIITAVVRDISHRTASTGAPYVTATASTSEWAAPLKWWALQGTDTAASMPRPGVYQIDGEWGEYKGQRELTTRTVPKHQPDADLTGLVRMSTRPDARDVIEATIKQLRRGPRALVGAALASRPTFWTSPAASFVHHAHVGGLAEHTCAMVETALAVQPHYDRTYGAEFIDWHIVIAGIIVHDIGKVAELEQDPCSSDFTSWGTALGHVLLGVQIVTQAFHALPPGECLPSEFQAIAHIIASHHGRLEHGAAVEPTTVEAHVAHAIDLMDSRVGSFVRAARDGGGTRKDWALGRVVVVERQVGGTNTRGRVSGKLTETSTQ